LPIDITGNISYNTDVATYHIIIDTNVIYSALRSKRGASAKLLSLIGTKRFEIHLSVPLVLEYEEILLREPVGWDIRPQDIADLIDSLCLLGKRHQTYFTWRPTLRDPNDEMVLELAVSSQSKYIITYNKKDFAGCDKFGIQLLTPKEFLQMIGEIP
jgi:putative PIN family toxin of toxin-antitoxin system